jgi:ketosteroid isomerase-like protein
VGDVGGGCRKDSEGLEAYLRGDFDEVLAVLDPDIIYKSAQEAPVQGREAVRAAWERWEASWEEVEMTSEEIIDAGDRHVQVILFRGRGQGSGVEVKARFYEVYTVRDGMTVRWEEFSDRAEALKAAGLRG